METAGLWDWAAGAARAASGVVASLWSDAGGLDGRAAFALGFAACLLVWQAVNALLGLALRLALVAAIGLGGLGAAAALQRALAPAAQDPAARAALPLHPPR